MIARILLQSRAAWYALYFSILLLLSTLVRDISPQPDLFAHIRDFMPATSNLGDPLSFATGALDVYHFGWFTEQNGWLVRLWPPGFMVLEGWVLRLFGIDAPFILILIVLNCALAAMLLLLVRQSLLLSIPPLYSSLLPLLPFCFSLPRLFLLQPVGIVLGECFAIMFFLMAMLLMAQAARTASWHTAIVAGLLLALAAYFRSQFEMFIMAMTILAVPSLVFYLCRRLLFQGPVDMARRRSQTWVAATVILALITCHLSMLPWRFATYLDPYAGNMSWVQTSQLVYANAGKTDQQLFAVGGNWIVYGGGNIACKLEPAYCGKTDKDLFYRTVVQHMGDWYAHKLANVRHYWFATLRDFTAPIRTPSLLEILESFFYLFCVLSIPPLLWRIRRHPQAAIYWWFCSSFYAGCFAVFTFVHFETRYFYALKIFSMFNVMLLLGMAWQMRKAADDSKTITRHAP